MCYLVPVVVAFAYLFVSTPSRGKIYGEAVLWCWIDIKWMDLWIALFYAVSRMLFWCCVG